MRARKNNQTREGWELAADAKAVLAKEERAGEKTEEKEKKVEPEIKTSIHQGVEDILNEQFRPVAKLDGYELYLMSQNPLKKGILEFKCTDNGLSYRVIDLDDKQITATIPWQQLPQLFPRDDRTILSEKDRLLPEILEITFKAGHTRLEEISSSSLHDEEKNFFDFSNRVDQVIKELSDLAKRESEEKFHCWLLIMSLGTKWEKRKKYLNRCWVRSLEKEILTIKEKTPLTSLAGMSNEALCNLYINLNGLRCRLLQSVSQDEWGLARYNELRGLIQEACVPEIGALNARLKRSVARDLNQLANPSEHCLTERVKPEFNVCLAVISFFIPPIFGFFIYLWYHERSCHRFLEEEKVNPTPNLNPNPNPTEALSMMTAAEIHSALEKNFSSCFIPPEPSCFAEPICRERSPNGEISTRTVEWTSPRHREPSPGKLSSTSKPLSRSASMPQKLSSGSNQSANSLSQASRSSLQQTAPSYEASPLQLPKAVSEIEGLPGASTRGSVLNTPQRREAALGSSSIYSRSADTTPRRKSSSGTVLESLKAGVPTIKIEEPEESQMRRSGHMRGSSAPLAAELRGVAMGDSREQKEEGARPRDAVVSQLLAVRM